MKNLILLLIPFLFISCALKEPKVIEYKQDISPFVKEIKPLHVEIVKFNSHYYMPWHIDSLKIDKKSASWANRVFFRDKKFFSENTLPWSLKDISPIIESTNFQEFGTANRYAITTKNTQIRNLPTDKPFFRDFKIAGEGYPFDYLQNSRIHINSPLFISHYSSDGSWAFAQTPFSYGWIKTDDMALLNRTQTKEFEESKKIVITKDNSALYAKYQKFFATANLGAILPFESEDEEFFYSYAFMENFAKESKKVKLTIPKNFVKIFPLTFNSSNIEDTINTLLNQRYGWGGYLANRDCSAMTKDFFRLFGVWLPRNSTAQKNAGRYINLKGKSNKEKEKIISKFAIPFQTLVYLKGHIMLYIGEKNKKAIVFHNLWGIKTQTEGKAGRYIIGRAIISDLYLGKNLKNIQKKSLLIDRVLAIAIL